MIAAWMLATLVAGALVALGALALDAACRAARRPTRGVWGAALALVVALAATAPLRRAPNVAPARLALPVAATAASAPAVPASWGARLADALGAVLAAPRAAAIAVTDAARSSLGTPVAAVARRVPPRADRWLLGAWAAASGALLLAALVAARRLARARRAWPAAELHGTRVHVAPVGGPAVVGLARAAIVVPAWLLGRPAAEQRLVLAHEAEHVRARDPLLLAAASVAAVLLPWHPAVWWMLARLRLAVETDCDRRVLARGASPSAYGTLLIDLAALRADGAAGARGLTSAALGAPMLGVPALVERRTDLERRLVTMSTPRSRHPRARLAAGALLAGAALLAACEPKLPTAAEVERADASTLLRTQGALPQASTERVSYRYFVDSVRVDAARALAIPADQIASMEVRRAPGAAGDREGEIRIVTVRALGKDGAPRGDVRTVRVRALRADSAIAVRVDSGASWGAVGAARDMVGRDGRVVEVVVVKNGGDASAKSGGEERAFAIVGAPATSGGARMAQDALVFVDGRRASEEEFAKLLPDRIQSVEVLKGPAAAKLYPDEPRAANGVIRITTKGAK